MKNQSYAKILVISCVALLLFAIILSTIILQCCDSDEPIDDDRSYLPSSKTTAGGDNATSEQTESTVDNTNQVASTTRENISIVTPPPEDMPQPNETDALLFESDGISVYIRSFNDDWETSIKFFVTNETNISTTVYVQIKAVNRYSISKYGSIDLVPYSAGIVDSFIYQGELTEYGITEIDNITISIHAIGDNYNGLFDEQLLTLTIDQLQNIMSD